MFGIVLFQPNFEDSDFSFGAISVITNGWGLARGDSAEKEKSGSSIQFL